MYQYHTKSDKQIINFVHIVLIIFRLPDIPEGDIRPEVVHMHGTDEMSTKDVFAYFQSYAPRNIEWINDASCKRMCEVTLAMIWLVESTLPSYMYCKLL